MSLQDKSHKPRLFCHSFLVRSLAVVPCVRIFAKDASLPMPVQIQSLARSWPCVCVLTWPCLSPLAQGLVPTTEPHSQPRGGNWSPGWTGVANILFCLPQNEAIARRPSAPRPQVRISTGWAGVCHWIEDSPFQIHPAPGRPPCQGLVGKQIF